MEDKEMLELAAKAAGLKVTAYDWQMGCRVVDDGVYRDFNPLADDGDALRLAVKLNLSVFIGREYICATHTEKPFCELEVTEQEFSDIQSATRRAITRAAAEIGRRLP